MTVLVPDPKYSEGRRTPNVGPLPDFQGNNPYTSGDAGRAYYEAMVTGGGPNREQQATLAARRAAGLPDEETEDEARERLIKSVSFMAGDPSARVSIQDLEGNPAFDSFREQASAAGFDPADIVNARNQNIETYEKGGTAKQIGDFMDRSGLGDAITYGTIGAGLAGAGTALAGAAGAGGGGAAGASGGGGATTYALPAAGGPSSITPLGASGAAAGGAAGAGGAAAGGGAAGGGAAAGTAAAGGAMANMPWWAVGAQVGGSLLGGHMASESAEDAAEAQLQGTREALDFQRESRDIALDMLRPEIATSQTALARMMQMSGQEIPSALQGAVGDIGEFELEEDPGYQFRQDESMRALEESAAARGGLMSGGFARQALRQASNLASQEYTNIYNRLASVANRQPVGQSQASTALNFGTNASNISQNAGDARASGYIAQGNAWQNTMDQIALALGGRFGNNQATAVT